MTLLFLLGNGALLLPMRAPLMVAALTVVMGIMLLVWSGKSLRGTTEVKTREGIIALLLQFLPVGVLIGRNLWLYSPDAMLYTVAAGAAFVAVRQLALFTDGKSTIRAVSGGLSLILAGVIGYGINETLAGTFIGVPLAQAIATLSAAALCYEVSTRSCESAAAYRSVATAVVVIGMTYNLLVFGGMLASLLTIGAGVALVAGSYVAQQRSAFIGGILLFVAGMIEQAVHVFRFFELGSWAGLALVGVLAIVFGSLLESKGALLKSGMEACKTRYREWSY
jgi:hypothetical protein